MIEKHWDGIVSYCDPNNKVPLGFVEGLNNKIRSIQKRAYGLHDEAYFSLKILTNNLPNYKSAPLTSEKSLFSLSSRHDSFLGIFLQATLS